MVTVTLERFYLSLRIPMEWVDHSRAPIEYTLKDDAPAVQVEIVRKLGDAKVAENYDHVERLGTERVVRVQTSVEPQPSFRYELRIGYRGQRKRGGR